MHVVLLVVLFSSCVEHAADLSLLVVYHVVSLSMQYSIFSRQTVGDCFFFYFGIFQFSEILALISVHEDSELPGATGRPQGECVVQGC